MEEVIFLVQGSSSEPYKVHFKKEGTNLNVYCNCNAGQNGMYCKHRFRILEGSKEDIVSPNIQDISIVKSWLCGTDVELAMIELEKAEKDFEDAKKRVTQMKKNFSKALTN